LQGLAEPTWFRVRFGYGELMALETPAHQVWRDAAQ